MERAIATRHLVMYRLAWRKRSITSWVDSRAIPQEPICEPIPGCEGWTPAAVRCLVLCCSTDLQNLLIPRRRFRNSSRMFATKKGEINHGKEGEQSLPAWKRRKRSRDQINERRHACREFIASNERAIQGQGRKMARQDRMAQRCELRAGSGDYPRLREEGLSAFH